MSALLRTAAAALAAALIAAAPAAASPSQLSILQDDKLLLRDGAQVREQRLDEFRALGVEVVKLNVEWRTIAPGGQAKPSGFDGQSPADYPTAAWAPYDAAIAGARARGLRVLLTISGPAPDWATAGPSDPEGVDRPDPGEFGRFVRAVGTRYSGDYRDPVPTPEDGGGLPLPLPAVASQAEGAEQQAPSEPLPRVDLWSVWNEPNLPRFLLPQRSSRKEPVSPHTYRGLYLAAHDALSATGHGSDTVLIGELLPVGRSSRGPRSSLRPLEFLRELACVDRRLRPFKGAAARRRGCETFRAIPGTGLAFHPYTLAGGPRVRPRHRDDASIGTLSRVTKLLDRLGARKRFATRRLPLWLTEFGFQSNPPERFGTPIRRIPAFMGQSEYLAFRNRRVRSFSQYPLADDAGTAGFQSGLRFADGRAKPGVYRAFELPLYVRRVSRTTVEVFGGVRAASGGTVRIEARKGRGRYRRIGTAKLNRRGYFRKRFRVRGSRVFRFEAGGRRSNALRG